MPTLKDLDDLMNTLIESSHGMTLEEFKRAAVGEIRTRFGGQKIYVTPAASRKDAMRAERVKQSAKTLPTGIVAQRYGVSAHYVRRIIRK